MSKKNCHSLPPIWEPQQTEEKGICGEKEVSECNLPGVRINTASKTLAGEIRLNDYYFGKAKQVLSNTCSLHI